MICVSFAMCVCVCMHMCAMRLVIHQLRCVADSVVAGLLALNLTQLNRAQPHSTRRGAFQFDLKYMKCLLCMQPNAINSMKRRQGECCVLRKYSNCLASSTLSMCMCAIGRWLFCSLPHLIWHFGLLFSCWSLLFACIFNKLTTTWTNAAYTYHYHTNRVHIFLHL